MSNATLRPAALAARAAFRLAAKTCGVERWVPLSTVALASAIKAGSMSASLSAMSAQSAR